AARRPSRSTRRTPAPPSPATGTARAARPATWSAPKPTSLRALIALGCFRRGSGSRPVPVAFCGSAPRRRRPERSGPRDRSERGNGRLAPRACGRQCRIEADRLAVLGERGPRVALALERQTQVEVGRRVRTLRNRAGELAHGIRRPARAQVREAEVVARVAERRVDLQR